MRAAAAAPLLSLFVARVGAATIIHVPADFPSIEEALAASFTGDSVIVACGTYIEHDLYVPDGVYLGSVTKDPECVVIDAQGLGRVIDCGGGKLQGLTITGGDVNGAAGGIGVSNGTVEVENCKIYGNRSTRGGGVFVQFDTSASLRNCEILLNTVPHSGADGGGLYCDSGSDVTLISCTLAANDASGSGGGLFATNATVSLDACTIFANSADSGGGLCATNASTITATRTTLSNNTASDEGGGLYAWTHPAPPTVATFIACDFVGNAATDFGGAVLVQASVELDLRECRFIGNQGYHGAAVYSHLAPVTAQLCEFLQNQSTGSGGAVFLSSGLAAVLGHCTFVGNVGTGPGGAIGYLFSAPRIEGCVFVHNSAPLGAAVSGRGDEDEQGVLERCTFWANSTPSSGAGSALAFSAVDGGVYTAEVSSCILVGNTGSAAVSCDGASPTVRCSDFFGNEVGDWTGCVPDQSGINGNFSADPLFCDAEGGDFTLSSQSPCLPGNHPDGVDCGLIGAFGQGCGTVSVEQETWAGIKGKYRDARP